MPVSAPPKWTEIKNKPTTVAGLGLSDLSPSASPPSFTVRAWAYFNGQGTPSIYGSGNVSSLTDLGVGDYRVNFTAAMPDQTFVAFGSCCGVPGLSWGGQVEINMESTAYVRCKVIGDAGGSGAIAPMDSTQVYVAVVR